MKYILTRKKSCCMAWDAIYHIGLVHFFSPCPLAVNFSLFSKPLTPSPSR